jgi:hypothetical protein
MTQDSGRSPFLRLREKETSGNIRSAGFVVFLAHSSRYYANGVCVSEVLLVGIVRIPIGPINLWGRIELMSSSSSSFPFLSAMLTHIPLDKSSNGNKRHLISLSRRGLSSNELQTGVLKEPQQQLVGNQTSTSLKVSPASSTYTLNNGSGGPSTAQRVIALAQTIRSPTEHNIVIRRDRNNYRRNSSQLWLGNHLSMLQAKFSSQDDQSLEGSSIPLITKLDK